MACASARLPAHARLPPLATDNLAVLLGDEGRGAEEVATLRRALAVKPDFANAWGNLGVALAQSGDVAAAGPPFEAAVQYDPSRKNLINLARWHQATGNREGAQAVMAQAQATPEQSG